MLAEQAIEVFFSYSHKDSDLRDELAKHLSILQRIGAITAWYDREITAGTEWAGEIDRHLNTADIILLLISADFLASDYCHDIELKRAMERHADGEACVIPVILREVDWRGTSFGKLQALPKNARPVTSWVDRDAAFADVARGIRQAVEELKKKVNGSLFATTIPITKEQENNMAERIAYMDSGNSNERIQANYYDTGKETSQNRSVSIGGSAIGSAIQTGDSNTASVQFKQSALPAPESVNIRAEISALRSALAKLENSDRRKIDNAFADALEELKKPEPDKGEVGQALDRALNYGKKAEGFVQLIEKLEPHLTKASAWLGNNWHNLLRTYL
jgi:TIR domain-containing protein